MTPLKSALYDAIADRFGTQAPLQILTVGEAPPCSARVTLRVRGMRRMFMAVVQEVDGYGSVSVFELDPRDEETQIPTRDDMAETFAQAIATAMTNRDGANE